MHLPFFQFIDFNDFMHAFNEHKIMDIKYRTSVINKVCVFAFVYDKCTFF